MLWALGPLLTAQSPARAKNTQKAGKLGDQSQVEEIYIARSVRESRVTPTEFCAEAKTGFKSTIEDQYTFRATATRTSDGRMIDTNARTIASGRACFGQTADNPAIANFYLDLHLGNTALKGIGDCRQTKSDFPERGLGVFHCFLSLSDPLSRYVGGQLTTNSIASLKLLGVETDPPGYTQSSIATIRLWKKRVER
jgi:hypothetical protein